MKIDKGGRLRRPLSSQQTVLLDDRVDAARPVERVLVKQPLDRHVARKHDGAAERSSLVSEETLDERPESLSRERRALDGRFGEPAEDERIEQRRPWIVALIAWQ